MRKGVKNRIKEVLEAQGRKISWVGDRLGVSRATAYRWVGNYTQPDIFQLKILSELLGVKMEELVE